MKIFLYLLKKTYFTIVNNGIKYVFIKSYRRIKSNTLRLFVNNKINKKRWLKIKGKYSKKRVFLIGNGPSLNKTPLYLLKDEYTMAFNRFNIMSERLNWHPTFFCVVDNLVVRDMIQEIDEIVKNTEFSFFPDIHFRGDNFKKMIKDNNKILWINQLLGEGFSLDLPKVYPGGSVIYEGIQILKYLGFEEIIMIGVDMNFQIHKTVKKIDSKGIDIVSQNDDDPNHFDPRYFGKNRKYHQPEKYVIDNIIKNLEYLGENMNKLGLKIINAGYDSKVSTFPKVNFEDILHFSKNDKKQIFEELLLEKTNYSSIEEFEKQSVYIKKSEDLHLGIGDFYTSLEMGLGILKDIVFTHIPLGPYDNKYYFLNKKQ